MGSSRKTISGSSASARASATRLVMPPDSSDGSLSASVAARPTMASLASAISSISAGEMSQMLAHRELHVFADASARRTARRAGTGRPSVARWRAARLRRWPVDDRSPRISMRPPRFGMRPMIVRNSTDLPLPEPPTRPRISPRSTVERQPIEHDVVAEADDADRDPDRRVGGAHGPGLTSRSRRRTWRTGRRAR